MKTTVLIIEDNVLVSEMYKYKLEMEGFEVIIKRDGITGLEKLEGMEKEPDVILLDLMMPNMNGFEVLEKVRQDLHLNHAKIIVFSNLNEPKDRERCFDLGADDFILKASITPKELIERIHKILA